MNPETPSSNGRMATILAVVGAFLIMAALVWTMRHFGQVPALNANRAAERAKAFGEMRAAETEALTHVGWVDPAKGIVRLRIEDAMQLVERNWQNPPAARSNLIARVEKATAVPPAQPNPFE